MVMFKNYTGPTCPNCGNTVVEWNAEKHADYEAAECGCRDYACETCLKSLAECANCGEPFQPTPENCDYCCSHCVNQSKGDDCPDGCPYCNDP